MLPLQRLKNLFATLTNQFPGIAFPARASFTPRKETSQHSLGERNVWSQKQYWNLKFCGLWLATKHMSFNSCKDINNLYIAMFPDSEMAIGFSCALTKWYLLCSGIDPFLKNNWMIAFQNMHLFPFALSHPKRTSWYPLYQVLGQRSTTGHQQISWFADFRPC